jgi:hypothetical protein
MAQITPAQGHGSPYPDGSTWLAILTSTVESIVREAEARFGERDRSYRVRGVEFHDGNPELYFPNSDRDIVIRLCRRRQSEPVELWYELAHECVHLLSPSGSLKATVLEEGLAVAFAEDYLREKRNVPQYPIGAPHYIRARDLARKLLAVDRSIIRVVRQRQPALYRITADDLRACSPQIPRDLAEQLAAPFRYA